MKKSLSIFTLFLIVVFLILGTWQIIRKGEKEALLLSLAQSQEAIAHHITDIPHPKSFQPLIATGRFLPGKTIFLQAKTHHGKSGLYVLDVFKTNEGLYLLVQRGWSEFEITEIPLETLNVEGFVRFPSHPNYFQPENISPTYFWIDIQALSKDLNLPLLSFYLVAKNSFHPLIFPTDPIPYPRNHHLGYAITWYLLAILLIFMLFCSRNKFKKGIINDSATHNSS